MLRPERFRMSIHERDVRFLPMTTRQKVEVDRTTADATFTNSSDLHKKTGAISDDKHL